MGSHKTCSSPGLDGIDYEVLKLLSPQYKFLLLDIYNEMYEASDFPIEWTKQYVHFIPKPNGCDFHPIALSSCLCKLFETLVTSTLLISYCTLIMGCSEITELSRLFWTLNRPLTMLILGYYSITRINRMSA